MKSPYLLPAVTAVMGFAIAWVAKPSDTHAPASPVTTAETPPAKSTRSSANSRPSVPDSKRPREVNAGDFPLADQAELGPKSRDEARMLRLTEALGLSIDQQGAIIRLIEETQAAADGNASVIQDLTTRGKAVEAGLAELLTPEQLAKFEEIRVRERENLIEQRSQKTLTAAIEEIDLSPQQREEVLSRLREKTKADMQSIPAAASLLFDKSLLPTNKKELSVDGILLLAKMGEETTGANPAEVQQKVIDRQRGELEEILRCFDGILTPGQMGQFQAAVAETKAILARLPKNLPQLDPDPEPEPDQTIVEEIPEPVVGAPPEPDDE